MEDTEKGDDAFKNIKVLSVSIFYENSGNCQGIYERDMLKLCFFSCAISEILQKGSFRSIA